LFALATINLTRATGEVLPRFGADTIHDPKAGGETTKGFREMLFPHHRRRQLMALIVTDKAEAVSTRILTNLNRGVTAMQGKAGIPARNDLS